MDFNGVQMVQGPNEKRLNRLVPIEVHYMEKILDCFHQKP